jgi:protein phosphatase
MGVFEYTTRGGREQNQDYLTYSETSGNISIYVVADGMGGYESGDVAAKVAGDAIVDYVCAHYSELKPEELLKQAYVHANNRLMTKRKTMGNFEMGCVVASVLVINNIAHIAWLGDSRAYILRHGDIHYVTVDHSMLNELMAAGTFKESDRARYESCVTRCIMGDNSSYEVGYKVLELENDDVIILCSDGLHKEVAVELLPSDDQLLRRQLDALSPSMADNCTLMRIKYTL